MNGKKILWLLTMTLLVISASCASFENEKNIARVASEDFYGRLIKDSPQNDEAGILQDGPGKNQLLEKLKVVREAVGDIRDKKLKKTEAWLNAEKVPVVSCEYELRTAERTFSQKLIWHVGDRSAKLAEVLTLSYDDKGQPALMVSKDGRIIY